MLQKILKGDLEMIFSDIQQKQAVQILHEELLPAMGCTEPIAIAYAAAVARETLGKAPARVEISVSGNIIKNAKSVVVPNTNGLKGIPAAAAAGIAAGQAERKLEVISSITERQQADIASFLKSCPIEVRASRGGAIFDIEIKVYAEGHSAEVEIRDFHTNIVRIEKDGQALPAENKTEMRGESGLTDRSFLSVESILDYARSCDLAEVRALLARQMQYNRAIAEEGMEHRWGAGIGRTIWDSAPENLRCRLRAAAAAGSDARMSGCEMPVVIVSGSGNQGLTASVPVMAYAKEIGADAEQEMRAVLLSDLLTIHLKSGIGRLSAYCGAVSAGCSAGAAIAFLDGADYPQIAHTLENALAIASGIVCDGAKPSCAAKIAAAVDAGITGWEMCKSGRNFHAGDGLVGEDVEKTITNIGRLARLGMRETDEEILRIMTDVPAGERAPASI